MDDGPFRVPRPVERRTPVRVPEPEPVVPPVPVEEPQPVKTEEPEAVEAPRRAVSMRPLMKDKKDRKPVNKFTVLIAVAVVIVVAAIIGWIMIASQPKTTAASTGIDSSKYQAVFFTNSQVYFGKLQMLNSDYMELTNVYYLQTQTSTGSSSTSANDQTSVLVKLSSAVHGPEDTMVIAKDQVLFYENLAPNGKVAQLIAAAQK